MSLLPYLQFKSRHGWLLKYPINVQTEKRVGIVSKKPFLPTRFFLYFFVVVQNKRVPKNSLSQHFRTIFKLNLTCISLSIDGNSSENFIPRGIEELRNGKFTFLGDRGRWNIFLGVLGEFSRNELSQKSWKSPKNSKKSWKKIQKKFQPWIYTPKFRMLGNNTKNWLVIQKNKNKNWKILTNFWKFSPFFIFKC